MHSYTRLFTHSLQRQWIAQAVAWRQLRAGQGWVGPSRTVLYTSCTAYSAASRLLLPPRLPRSSSSNIISSHESWKQCNNLAAVAENKLCFLFDWFRPRNFLEKRQQSANERLREGGRDNMTCGLLQQTIPIKCDIRDSIQTPQVNRNFRWAELSFFNCVRAIKCVGRLRVEKEMKHS